MSSMYMCSNAAYVCVTFDAKLNAAVCVPSCLNGGRCVVPNVCNCTSDWRGETCSERKSICGKANMFNFFT